MSHTALISPAHGLHIYTATRIPPLPAVSQLLPRSTTTTTTTRGACKNIPSGGPPFQIEEPLNAEKIADALPSRRPRNIRVVSTQAHKPDKNAAPRNHGSVVAINRILVWLLHLRRDDPDVGGPRQWQGIGDLCRARRLVDLERRSARVDVFTSSTGSEWHLFRRKIHHFFVRLSLRW